MNLFRVCLGLIGLFNFMGVLGSGWLTDRFDPRKLLSMYYILEEKYAQEALEGGVNVTNCTFGTEEAWDVVLPNIERGLERIEKMLASTGTARPLGCAVILAQAGGVET